MNTARRPGQATVVGKLRRLMPSEPITAAEARSVAERQADKLRELLGLTDAPVNVGRLARLPKIRVETQPRWRMPALAGFSQWANRRWLIVINQDNSAGRRRFTLAHEFKHILDHPVKDLAYTRLGDSDLRRREREIEQICDHFAACLLMPELAVIQGWDQLHSPTMLASRFGVTLAAMTVRLQYFGFLDDVRPMAYLPGGQAGGQEPWQDPYVAA